MDRACPHASSAGSTRGTNVCPNTPDPPKRPRDEVSLSDLPPRSAAADRATAASRKADDDALAIEDLPPRRNVTGG